MGNLQWKPRNILRARPHGDRKVVQEVEGLSGGRSLCHRRSPEKPFAITFTHFPVGLSSGAPMVAYQSAISYSYAFVQSVVASG